MVLIIILFFLIIISVLINHLFFSLPLHNQLFKTRIHAVQQFEAAEVGLSYGEKLLMQQLLQKSHDFTLPYTTTLVYHGYTIYITVLKLPEELCILPHKRAGHYYQSTTRVKSHISFPYGNEIILRTTIALPDGKICKRKLPQRLVGRSSWCQLN